MLGDTVGAVYVEVLADTHRLKRQIERATKDGGTESAEVFGAEFEQALEKRLNKATFGKMLDKRLTNEARNMARHVQTAVDDHPITFSIGDDLANDINRLADQFGIGLDEVEDMVSDRLAGSFDRALKDMERDARRSKSTVGDAIGDVFSDISFDKALQNLTDDIVKGVPKAFQEGIEQGLEGMQFDTSNMDQFDDIARRFGFSVREIEDEVKRRIPAAYKKALADAEKEAKKAAPKIAKAVTRSLEDALDDVNFTTALDRLSRDLEKKITPAMRKALKEGQKVDFTWDDDARRELRKLGESFNVSFANIQRAINQRLGQIVTPSARQNPFEALDRSITKLRLSLRRMGTGGAFDSITSGFGGIIGLSFQIGKALQRLTFAIAGGFGKGLTAAGEAMKTMAAAGGRLSGVLGKLGGGMAKFGGAITKFLKSPLGLAAGALLAFVGGLNMLSKFMGAFVTLAVDLAGMFSMIAAAAGAAVVSSAALVPVIVSLAAGMGALVIGSMDAVKAFGAWQKAMEETDPKARAKAMEKYNEALKKLGPNAREATKAMIAVTGSFAAFRKEMGEKLFGGGDTGLADAIRASQPLIDAMKAGMLGVSAAVGDVLDKFLRLGENKQFMEDFTTLWDAAAGIVGNFGAALVNVFEGLTAFFAVISPFATLLSEKVLEISERFAAWLDTEEGRQQLLDFFSQAWTLASQLWDVFMSLVGVVGAFFAAIISGPEGAESGGFLATIKTKLDELKLKIQEMDENGTLQRWFATAKETGGRLWDTLVLINGTLKALNTEENRAFLHNLITAINATIIALNFLMAAAKFTFNNITLVIRGAITAFQTLHRWIGNVLDAIGRIHFPDIPGAWRKLMGNLHFAAGGIVMGPTRALIGEAGPEAVIPLTRPLARVDPSVRGMAALVRGQATTGGGGTGRVLNQTVNVVTNTADPAAVAYEVLNKTVAMAV